MLFKQDYKQRALLLQSVAIFSEVDFDSLLNVAERLSQRIVKKDEVIFNEGDIDYALYIIESGKIKVHVENHTFATFGPAQFFGEYSLLDSTPRSTSATAIQDSTLWRLDQKHFFALLNSNNKLTQELLKSLVWRLRDYNTLESELTAKNVEIKKQKEAIEIQTKELESLNQTKDKFFAIIAHDLKNPFSTVVGLSELLAKEFETLDRDKQRDFVMQIYKYSDKTYNLLENLLQWSLLQTGRKKLFIENGNISTLISENIELLKGNTKPKNISILWDGSNDYIANFDINMINTVIRNLLTNAIKFTPANGQIVVSITSYSEFWRISVADNGIGISAKDQQKLFRIDSNPSTIGTSEERGTGLGLILCREFVERNGGKIGVSSVLNEGSTFWFTIPKLGKEIECK